MALSLQRYIAYIESDMHRTLKERIEKKRERSGVTVVTNVKVHIPQNVILEILSWLPVKDVLRFKTVCKSWCGIISTPIFVTNHLKNHNRDYNGDSEDCLLVQYDPGQLYEVLIDEASKMVDVELLYGMPMYVSHLCGPCDGIYYLFHCDYQKRALWNPAINEIKYLPSVITKPDHIPPHLIHARHEVCGFGYDTKTEDYKVVVIKGYWNKYPDDTNEVTHPASVLVYSFKTDSWRYWGDLARKYYLQQNRCYIVINGCFYWLGSRKVSGNYEFIISFDMGTDAIQEIKLPHLTDLTDYIETLAIYDDCLSFLAVHWIENRLGIWTLSEGVWTKKFTMGCISIPGLWRPIGHWKKNKVILENKHHRLVLCDTETQEIKELAVQTRGCDKMICQGIFVYRESLLSLESESRKFRGWEECSSFDIDLLFSDI